MDTAPTKAELLDQIRQGRAAWEALLAEVPSARWDAPGVEDSWSVKDIIAHVTACERWMAERLESVQAGGPFVPPDDPYADEDVDEQNARMQAESRALSLSTVLADAPRAHAQLLAAVEALDDADLHDPARLGMPPDRQPWNVIAGNAHSHYAEHTPAIRDWLDNVVIPLSLSSGEG